MIRSVRLGYAVGLVLSSCLTAALLPASAAAQANGYNSLGLEWTAGGDDGTTGTASYYELKYSAVQPSGSDSASIAAWWSSATAVGSGLPVPRASGSTDSTRVTNLTPGTNYYFVIRSVDDGGNRSPFSNVATGATAACSYPTTAPTSLAAVADTGRVDLTWGGSDPQTTQIDIYRGTSSTTQTLYTTLSSASATSYTDNSVNPGVTYWYRVAFASTCSPGPSTSPVSATLPGTPPPPEADAAKLHAYPNPSAGASSIQFVIHVPGAASQGVLLRLYDLSGRWIATLADGSFAPGDHAVSWNRVSRTGRAVSPGYYEAIGTVGGTRVQQRVLLTP